MSGGLRRLEEGLVLLLAVAISLSIAATEILFFSAAALRLVRAARGEPLRLGPRPVAWAWAALAAAWLAAGVLAPEPTSSIVRVHRLYVVFVLFLVAEHARSPAGARRLAAAYLVGAALGSGYGLAAWGHRVLQAPSRERLAGAFSTAVTAGNVLATSLVAVFAVLVGPAARLRGWAGACAMPVAVALAATRSRSSWLGALAGAATVAALGRSRRWVVAALVVLAAMAAAVPSVRERAASIVNPTDSTARGRVSLWKSGWELFCERPVLGWGLADQKRLIAEHRRADATFVAGHFHNNVVEVAVSSGSLGLAAYAALHGALAWALWRARRRAPWSAAALGVWVSFQVGGLFDWSFGDAEVAYQFFFWMGLGLADNPGAEPAALVDPPRGA